MGFASRAPQSDWQPWWRERPQPFANDPVVVSTAPTKPVSNDEATGDIIARLSRLERLRKHGYIDDTEHLNLRRVILSKI